MTEELDLKWSDIDEIQRRLEKKLTEKEKKILCCECHEKIITVQTLHEDPKTKKFEKEDYSDFCFSCWIQQDYGIYRDDEIPHNVSDQIRDDLKKFRISFMTAFVFREKVT